MLLKTEAIRAQIALSLISGLGAQRITRLIRHFKEPERIFNRSHKELLRVEGVGQGIVKQISTFSDWDAVDRIIKYAADNNVWLLTFTDERYPEKLRHIYDPPIMLWGKGDIQALSKPGIAVIGTRKPTLYGKEMAELFSKALISKGLSVISGLAYGIDTIAHRVSADQNGVTVAVLGSGIDRIYPESNKNLVQRIIDENGAVISEFPPGTKPDAGNFPIRNRIVSGLSLGVLVVESGITGGSIITANLALDQGREVFAIPHPIGRANGEGCNTLIKKGQSKLVQNLNDILNEIQVEFLDTTVSVVEPSWKKQQLTDFESDLCKALQEPVQIDDLAEALQKPGYTILPVLLQLELKGCVKALPGKKFKAV